MQAISEKPSLLSGQRTPFLISALLVVAFSFGCAPPGGGSTDRPELTDEIIRERINDARVFDVPEENGTAPPISWGFDENEPKEIAVIEKKVEGTTATIVLDIKTSSAPRAREQRYLTGQIRTMWELQTGWALRRWEIVEAENISMKYRNIVKNADDTGGVNSPPQRITPSPKAGASPPL